jgi:hypothetical protein
VIAIVALSSCKKNTSNNPIDELPAATQTGANTFGCLINGQAFTPGGGDGFGSPTLAGTYQYAYSTPVPLGMPLNPYSGYIFDIEARDMRNSCSITGIGFAVDSIQVQQGYTYILQSEEAGTGDAGYQYLNCSGTDNWFKTSDTTTRGQLYLSRFDLSNKIASGTFWFNVLDNNGDTIKITDGRFDVHFTQ